jgi:hypothetical protein
VREATASELALSRQSAAALAAQKAGRLDDNVKAERRQALQALVNQKTAAAAGALPKRQRDASPAAPVRQETQAVQSKTKPARQETESVQSKTKPAKVKRARTAVLDSDEDAEQEAEAEAEDGEAEAKKEEEEEEEEEGGEEEEEEEEGGVAADAPELDKVLPTAHRVPSPSPPILCACGNVGGVGS